MHPINQEIDNLLRFDSLDMAEKLTGKDYKADTETVLLGMALMHSCGKQMDRLMHATDDTTFNSKVGDYLRIAKDIGFKIILAEEFAGRDNTTDTLYVLWDDRGILLRFDTFWNGDSVNSATVWYNLVPFNHRDKSFYHVTSSGGLHRRYAGSHIFLKDSFGLHQFDFKKNEKLGEERFYYDEYVWSGDHDAREALRHKIAALESCGTFLAKWENAPFLWLLHYMDTKQDGYDYEAINKNRISRFPVYVQEAISTIT